MTHRFTKSILALTVLGLSSLSMADPRFDTSKYEGWDLKLGANYQQFSNNGSTYALNTTNNTQYDIDPSYHFGYNLGLGYHVPNKDSDIDLEYSHLKTSDSSTVNGPGVFLSTDMLAGPFNWASGKNDFSFDSVDLTAGHKITMSPYFDLDYYGGLSYTQLKKDSTLTGTSPGLTYVNDLGTSFSGIGPTFGMDGDCTPFPDTVPYFGVTGGLKASTLYGTMSGYSHVNDNGTTFSDNIPDSKIVVPAMGAKLGLTYNYNINKTMIGAELGYQATEYFGATKDMNYNNTSNASLQGGYFKVNARF